MGGGIGHENPKSREQRAESREQRAAPLLTFCPSTFPAAWLWRGRPLLTAALALLSLLLLCFENAQAQTADTEVSIEAGTSPVTEGADATFTLSRTGPTTATLVVDVSVTETGSVLSVTPSMTVTFDVGDSSATLTVTTDNDAVVEDPSTVTATVAPASDNRYQVVATANEATVTVEDNDTAALTLSVDETVVAEADTGAATLTATITNGVTFAKAQDVTVTLGGSATAGSDFTFTDAAGRTLARPYGLRFRRGASSATGTITAVNDTRDDDAETIVIDASYGGSAVGSQHTIAITDDDVPPFGVGTGAIGRDGFGEGHVPAVRPRHASLCRRLQRPGYRDVDVVHEGGRYAAFGQRDATKLEPECGSRTDGSG